MYDEYERFLKQYSSLYGTNTAIFLMVGGFYELYDLVDTETSTPKCNTQEIADVLNIRLTVRKDDTPPGYEGRFWGFPVDALHKWAARLTDAGWTVIIVDQLKTKTGKRIERAVSRILSPGTHVENLGSGTTRSISCVYLIQNDIDAPMYAAASFDLSTGITTTTYGETYGRIETWKCDDLAHFLQVQSTNELLVFWEGDAVRAPSEEFVRRQLNYPRAAIHMKQRVSLGSLSAVHARDEFFREIYAIKSMLPVADWLKLATSEEAIALTHLLLFIKEMNPTNFQRLHSNRPYIAKNHMILGNNALSQLQITSARIQDSVLGLFQSCITPMGKRAIKRRLLTPITDGVQLQMRYEQISAMQNIGDADMKEIVRRLREIYDLPRLHRRLICAQVVADDIYSLHQSYLAAETLAEYLPPNLQPPASLIADLATWRSSVFEADFSADKAAAINDNSTFLNTSTARYTHIFDKETKLQQLEREAGDFVIRCRSFAGVSVESSAVRVEGQEGTPYGVKATPVAAKELEKAFKAQGGASALVSAFKGAHLRSLKSASWVECPWLSTLNESVNKLRADMQHDVTMCLPDICGTVADAAGELWSQLEEWIELVDITRCLAIESATHGYTKPQICQAAADGGASFSATNLRHPLIESAISRTEYISHSVQFDDSVRGWLVYGMNASGKSSLMKAIGIAIHLAQCGCFVPASNCRLAPFNSLYTRIINRDDLWAGMSSFAMEMSEMREFLDTANKGTMILGDELCNGTESQSAKAIVAAGIDWLAERHARYFFATHLHGLLDVLAEPADLGLKVWHLRVEYDAVADRLIYKRALLPGAGSTLYGLEVARAMHLPVAFLEKAHAYRRKLLGTAREDEGIVSAWNSAVSRRVCEVCKHEIVRDLEVHHIRPRAAAATQSRFADGAGRDDQRNLVVVCQKCHDAHHASQIEIGALQQTSEGPIRTVVTKVVAVPAVTAAAATTATENPFQKFAYKTTRSKSPEHTLTADDLATILIVMQKYPALSMRQLVPKLRNDYEIEVEESVLRKIKKNGY